MELIKEKFHPYNIKIDKVKSFDPEGFINRERGIYKLSTYLHQLDNIEDLIRISL